MAIKALDTTITHLHVCKDDDPQDPTTWKLATLTSRDVARIRDGVTSFELTPSEDEDAKGTTKTSIEKSKLTFEACRRGIVGWENFLHPTTNEPIKFEDQAREIDGKQRRVVKPELLDMIPLEVLEELADVIMGVNEPKEGELGNLHEPRSEGSCTQPEAVPDAELVTES